MTCDSEPGSGPDSGSDFGFGPDSGSDSGFGFEPDSGPAPGPMTIASIGEFALIQRIRAVVEDPPGRPREPGTSSDLLLGIGDDAALIRPEPGWDLALTCDTHVCGRHFDPRWMGADAIGRRAMMVNLSDIAAMGGEPRHALVSLGLPGSMEVAVVEELYRGFLNALAETEARIVGGNLTSSGPEWFVDITLVGRIEQGRALTRAGARPGDRILVTGSPGRSAAGLAILRAITERRASAPGVVPGTLPAIHQAIEQFLTSNQWARSLVRAFRRPTARLAAGRWMAKAADRPVTALVDLSDGLVGDLAHLCVCSGVRARIEADRLPHDADLEAAASYFGLVRTAWTLGPGDDYELLLIVRPAASERVVNELRAATGLTVTEIGEILPPAVPSKGAVSSQGGVSSKGTVPPSAVCPPTEQIGIDASLIEVLGLSPGEHHGGGWDHFRVKP
jgi:thiamine-monophosphate kinase